MNSIKVMSRNIFMCASDLAVITGHNPYKEKSEITLKYWKKHFKDDYVETHTSEDIYKTIKKAKKKLLKISVKYDGPVEAPIKKDEKIAILKVVYDDEIVGEYDLLSSREIKKVNLLSKLIKSLNYLIWGDV